MVFFSSVALCQSAACTLGQLCGPWDARSTNRFKTRLPHTHASLHGHALTPPQWARATTHKNQNQTAIHENALASEQILTRGLAAVSHPSPTAAAALPAAYSAEERGRAAILRAAAYASTLLLLHFRPISSVPDGPSASAPLDGSRRRLLLAVAAAAADADDEDNDAWVLLRSTRRSPALVLGCSRLDYSSRRRTRTSARGDRARGTASAAPNCQRRASAERWPSGPACPGGRRACEQARARRREGRRRLCCCCCLTMRPMLRRRWRRRSACPPHCCPHCPRAPPQEAPPSASGCLVRRSALRSRPAANAGPPPQIAWRRRRCCCCCRCHRFRLRFRRTSLRRYCLAHPPIDRRYRYERSPHHARAMPRLRAASGRSAPRQSPNRYHQG